VESISILLVEDETLIQAMVPMGRAGGHWKLGQQAGKIDRNGPWEVDKWIGVTEQAR